MEFDRKRNIISQTLCCSNLIIFSSLIIVHLKSIVNSIRELLVIYMSRLPYNFFSMLMIVKSLSFIYLLFIYYDAVSTVNANHC